MGCITLGVVQTHSCLPSERWLGLTVFTDRGENFKCTLLCLKHKHGFQTCGEHVVRVKRQLEDKSYCKNIFSAYELTCLACLCTYTRAYSQFFCLQAVNILAKASALTSSMRMCTHTSVCALWKEVPYPTGGAAAVEEQWLLLQGDSFTPRISVLNICFQAPCFIQTAFLCQAGWAKKSGSKLVCFMENFPLLFLTKQEVELTSVFLFADISESCSSS